MTKIYELTAEKRDVSIKRSALNAENKVPAVVYGSGIDSTALTLDASDILRLYRKTGTSNLIDLSIAGGKSIKVLIKKLDIHPVQYKISHVDFFAVDMKKPTDVLVPFEFKGVSPAVKNFGAVVTVSHESILLRCLPGDIPSNIEVPVTKLKDMGDSIKVGDLSLDEKKFRIMNLTDKITICAASGRKAAAKVDEEVAEETEETAAATE